MDSHEYDRLKAQRAEIERKMALHNQCEAEELRQGIEKLIEEFDDYSDDDNNEHLSRQLQKLLDDIDARDSLAVLELVELLKVEYAELQKDFNTEHTHNHELLERIDGFKVLVREVKSFFAGAEFCNGDIPCFEECWQCRATAAMRVIGDDVGSGPDVFELTTVASRYQDALIAIRDLDAASRPGIPWVHWSKLAAQALGEEQE
ncbi:hypothetical protein DRQ25_05235 [Candidatus Fermentibacteria bacterium]|nr:MAG: hypothetical protein DRQ25_05235 [Candidatus Fermentibacteria bacterium]